MEWIQWVDVAAAVDEADKAHFAQQLQPKAKKWLAQPDIHCDGCVFHFKLLCACVCVYAYGVS